MSNSDAAACALVVAGDSRPVRQGHFWPWSASTRTRAAPPAATTTADLLAARAAGPLRARRRALCQVAPSELALRFARARGCGQPYSKTSARACCHLRGPSGGGDGAADAITVNGTQGLDAFGAAGDAGGVTVFGLHTAVDLLFQEQANDRLTLNGQAGDDVIDATSLEADGIQLTMNGGLGADLFLGSQGGDLVNGGDGNDTALMAAGDDTFVWNPGDDNDTIEGQGGLDRMLFNGANIAEQITISANGRRVLFFRNVASVVMDMNGVE